MAESTLNLKWADLLSEGGDFMGWGRDAAGWDERQQSQLDSAMKSGMRKFFFQAQLSPRDPVHGWTFLKPVADVAVASGVATAALPDDFGGFEGRVTVTQAGSSGGFWPVKQVDEEAIRALYAAVADISGKPQKFAEEQVRGTTATASNRSRLLVYPVPDAAYTFRVPYYILPNYLSTANPYPYGGAAHAETMKAAVRSALELYMDNEPGSETANYMQCLAASIQYDRRHEPKSLGPNYDPSDSLAGRRGPWPEGVWHPLGIGYLGTASY